MNGSPSDRRAQLPAPLTARVTSHMKQTIRNTRRAITATLILTAVLSTFPVATAQAATTTNRYSYVPRKICPIDWREGRWHVKQLIKCAANHWGVSPTKALVVADRESDFRPRAFNRSSCAKGVFQHLCRYWKSRAYAYGFKDYSAFNGRANIIVTMKMVRRYGWSPWTTA